MAPPRFVSRACFLAVGLTALAGPAPGAVSGFVRTPEGDPIGSAQVRLQAESAPVAITADDGSFTLPVAFVGLRTVTASLPYAPGAAENFSSGGTVAVLDGTTGLDIRLPRIPAASGSPLGLPDSSICGDCHGDHLAEWSRSVHSGAAVDAWVLDLFSGTGTPGGSAGYVYKNTHDPGETGFCATCHAPLEDAANPGHLMLDAVASLPGRDGVGCLGCHQIDSVNEDSNALHTLGNATYRFPDDPDVGTARFVWGPLPDVIDIMRASESAVFRESRFCGSCHQYSNPEHPEVPGQTTYSEWQASPHAVPGPGYRTCQDCHMPEAASPGPITTIGSPIRPAGQRRGHAFVGSTPGGLGGAITLSASGAEVGGQVRVTALVKNQGAGHSFPTGVSVRNALLVIDASFQGEPLTQVSGPTVPFWADDDVPGTQAGDLAGQPGKGFARILEGRINGTGPVLRPVLFIDAERVFSETNIPAGQTDTTSVAFALPAGAHAGDPVDVTVRLLYRRAFRATAVTKGWTRTPQGGPIEIEVARRQFQVTLATPVELQGFSVE